MTLDDIANYTPIVREALSFKYGDFDLFLAPAVSLRMCVCVCVCVCVCLCVCLCVSVCVHGRSLPAKQCIASGVLIVRQSRKLPMPT